MLMQLPGHVEKYIPNTEVEHLCLQYLGYKEDALLIRKEYITTIQKVEMRQKGSAHPGGTVITGQPGIGMCQWLCCSCL